VRVLVVDGETATMSEVAAALRDRGFEAVVLASGRAAERALAAFRPDVVVLDVAAPDLDPTEIARGLVDGRRPSPLICLTATHAAANAAPGIAAGDGGLATFDLVELLDRMCAALGLPLREQLETGTLRFADVVLNEQTHEVTRAGAPVELSPTEFNLLRFFLYNPRRILGKRQILDNVWQSDYDGDARIVETYVSYLRKKLDRLGPPLIQTVRLVGYVLRDPARAVGSAPAVTAADALPTRSVTTEPVQVAVDQGRERRLVPRVDEVSVPGELPSR
jgi:two-component system, OmpR family, response regulator